MANSVYLKCPSAKLPREERLDALMANINAWLESDAFQSLIRLFGGTKADGGSLQSRVQAYNNFVEIWDYRKKAANGGERWLIAENQFNTEHKSQIMDCMQQLGLLDMTECTEQPDYILPLGGARMANLDRCLGAAHAANLFPDTDIPVIALTGMRPISEIERPYVDTYAPGAETEYDAICQGMVKAFSLNPEQYTETRESNSNQNLSWAERRYVSDSKVFDRNYCILSAPSSDPVRRANSMDTFEYFLKRYALGTGERVLLVTSCIYVPFQLMKFTALAMEKGFEVDCIGYLGGSTGSVLNTSSYLQEVKATINAIHALLN